MGLPDRVHRLTCTSYYNYNLSSLLLHTKEECSMDDIYSVSRAVILLHDISVMVSDTYSILLNNNCRKIFSIRNSGICAKTKRSQKLRFKLVSQAEFCIIEINKQLLISRNITN